MTLIKPTPRFVKSIVVRFDNDAEISFADKVLTRLFEALPHNRNIEEVFPKVLVLDNLYRTNLYRTNIHAIHAVARRICELDIDPELEEKSLSLVNDIAHVEISGQKKCLRSFASKYCSWHRPDVYPIYDSIVSKLIWAYQKSCSFADFKRYELIDWPDYPRYAEIIGQFRDHFGLNDFSFKELDEFLWLYGKNRDGIFDKYGLEREVS